MSGLFVSSIESRRLEYYFGEIASGREDSRRGLSDRDVDFFGGWSSGGSVNHALGNIHRELKDVQEDIRFRRRVKNVGYDLCFSAPKQVSVLFGLMQTEIADEILEAHKSSVSKVFNSLEPTLTWGTHANIDAVGFVHQNSRALDPHLHTHLIIANRCEVAPGKLRAVNSSDLYSRVSQFSRDYRINLAREIYARMGLVMVERDIYTNGGPTQIPNFPEEVATLFSKRAAEVSNLASKWQTDAPGALRTASLMTRSAKVALDDEVLRTRWTRDLASLGYSVDQLTKQLRCELRPRKVHLPFHDRSSTSNVDEMMSRFENPSRAQGQLRIVSYREDLFERMAAFSKGRTVSVISGSKEVTKIEQPRLPLVESLLEPVEVIVLGKMDIGLLAEVLNRHLHQDVFIALPESEANSSVLRGYVDHGEEIKAERCPGSSQAECLDGRRPSYDESSLREALTRVAQEAASFSLDGLMTYRMILGSNRDRDLARQYVANQLGLEISNEGFYEGEAVRVNYLPKRYSLTRPEIGVVSQEDGVVRLGNCGAKIEVLLSELNSKAMLSPLAIMGRNEARRTLPDHLDRDVSLGSFALYDGESETIIRCGQERGRRYYGSKQLEFENHLLPNFSKSLKRYKSPLGIGKDLGI